MVKIRRHLEADDDPETLTYSERFEDWLGEHVRVSSEHCRLVQRHHPLSRSSVDRSLQRGKFCVTMRVCVRGRNSFDS